MNLYVVTQIEMPDSDIVSRCLGIFPSFEEASKFLDKEIAESQAQNPDLTYDVDQGYCYGDGYRCQWDILDCEVDNSVIRGV